MQRVATYTLERRDGVDSAQILAAEFDGTKREIESWLSSKAAIGTATEGEFTTEDGSEGKYRIREALGDEGSSWTLQLDEASRDGRRFTAHLSVLALKQCLKVHVVLEAGLRADQVRPLVVDVRCPRVVRSLLELPGKWYHGNSAIRDREAVRGFVAGEKLVERICSADRSLPLVVVSTAGTGLALPNLDQKVAYDLAGLASVVVIDEEASWALTDLLGAKWACYWGAVRLFWPGFAIEQDRFSHPLWTRERLTGLAETPERCLGRLRSHLRSMVFRASVVSVGRPPEIDKIHDAATLNALLDLRRSAKSVDEFRELADLYSKENDELRLERDRLRDRESELEQELAQAEADKRSLKSHLESKGGKNREEEATPSSHTNDEAAAPPERGETRFYKKVHSRPGYDVLVPIQDCGHNNWQNAAKADKAKKGIERHEGGRRDWKNVQHCGTCTGGGVWKVRW